MGPMCGSCVSGYTFSSSASLCVECSSSTNFSPLIVMAVVLVLVGAVVVVRVARGGGGGGGSVLPRCLAAAEPLVRVVRHIDKGELKVLWSTFQILSSVQWALSVKLPDPFSNFLKIVAFTSLDALTLDCVDGSEESFYNRLYVTQFVPLALVTAIATGGGLRVVRARWDHHRRFFRGQQNSSKQQGKQGSKQRGKQHGKQHGERRGKRGQRKALQQLQRKIESVVSQHTYAALVVTYCGE
jgi:hypothetical protein